MYEYQYIVMDTGGGIFVNNMEANHRKIIDEEAAKGWRYVGYVPMEFSSRGGISSIDLIFEREKRDPGAARSVVEN